MVITGFVAAIIFFGIGHLLHRRGTYWVGHFFIGLAFLSIAGTSVGLWLQQKSSEGLNILASFIVSLFHR